ncbi:MAG: o-succinylbenzoate--CoA ligase [Frankiales bacterium]|jgi:acyl-CoA synthetase|nr:o-succinylbenzoate--CoA ligase [Frankiales bacterium]
MTMATTLGRYSQQEIDSYYQDGHWQKGNLADLIELQAEKRPDKVFCFDDTTSMTYGEMRERSLRVALGLQRLGLHAGDRIVVQLPNWTEFALTAAGAARIGVVVVPVMPIYREDEVAYVVGHSGARLAVTCDEFKGFRYVDMHAGLIATCESLERVVCVSRSGSSVAEGVTPFEQLAADGPLDDVVAELGAAPGPDDPFVIVYTSGTTARPKGCLHTFNTMAATARVIADALEYTESDVQFGPSPITHSTGLVTSVLLPMMSGASSYFMDTWTPEGGLEAIARHKLTAAVTATAFLQMLMTAYDPERHDASSLRLWLCAGSPIPSAVVEKATKLFTGCKVLSLYGRSENFSTTMCRISDDPVRSSTSDGRAQGGAEVQIVDPLGVEVPRGEVGDIAYKGPSHMLGYYQDPQATDELFTDAGFSRSGDLGVMDEDGFVRVTGRLKDIVIRGGLNISARELEELLLGHPAIGDAAVVGMPDERLGEKVCVFAVLAPGQPAPTLAEIVAYLKERRLATPKLPERLEIVDALPMTATGKVQKHVLRADIAQRV